MAIDALYDLGTLNFLGGGAFRLDGIEDRSEDPGLTPHIRSSAGRFDPSYIATAAAMPMLTGTFTECAKVLANISGLTGLAVSAAGAVTALEAYFTKCEDLANKATGNNHLKVAINKAIVIPEALTVRQEPPATITLSVHVLSDGTNPVFTFTDSVALPANAQIAEQFLLGPVTVNGVNLKAVTGWTLNFGLSVQKRMNEGGLYPVYGTVMSRGPSIEIDTEDPRQLGTYGVGTAISASGATLYARKMLKQSTRVPDATAEHIKITLPASQGMIFPRSFSGGNNAARSGGIRLVPIDGAATLLAISAASAIT